jgi:hypothetical protein
VSRLHWGPGQGLEQLDQVARGILEENLLDPDSGDHLVAEAGTLGPELCDAGLEVGNLAGNGTWAGGETVHITHQRAILPHDRRAAVSNEWAGLVCGCGAGGATLLCVLYPPEIGCGPSRPASRDLAPALRAPERPMTTAHGSARDVVVRDER